MKDGERLHLTDIRIEEYDPRDHSKARQFRGHGIGSQLLARFLCESDTVGIRETWGSVTPEDIKNTPHLLTWYEKYGFTSHRAGQRLPEGYGKEDCAATLTTPHLERARERFPHPTTRDTP